MRGDFYVISQKEGNMSKKKNIIRKLQKGRFYYVHEGSPTGHPGMIYWKNDKKNLYLSLTTGTSYNKDLLPLNAPTDSQVKMSYVNKKPFLGKRKDYGNKVLVDMKFSKLDKKMILHDISKAEPRYSKTLSRKDKRYFKKMRKKKNIKY